MYWKCNVHITELINAFNNIFSILQEKKALNIKKYVPPIHSVPKINKNSTLGQQIKHYRRYKNIKQTDLSIKLGFERSALHNLENYPTKLVNVNLIKGIIEELGIKDKLKINDDYITFLLDNPCDKITAIRNELNLTRQQFADMLDVNITSVRRWELGNCHISRAKYEQLKRCMI